jgi:lysophospholipase L1-like esterase
MARRPLFGSSPEQMRRARRALGGLCVLGSCALVLTQTDSIGPREARAQASTPSDHEPTLLPLVPLKALVDESDDTLVPALARVFRVPHAEKRQLPSLDDDDDTLMALARALEMQGGFLTDPCRVWQGEVCVSTALTPFFLALDDTRERRAKTRVSVIGNSLIVSDRIVDVWRTRMQERFGDGGKGFLLTDSMTSYTSRARTSSRAQGFAPHNVVFGPRGQEPFGVAGALFVSRGRAEAHFDLDGATDAEVFWLDRLGAPRIEVLVDDALHTTLEPVADSKTERRAAMTTLRVPANARTLTLRTEEPGAVLYGVDLENAEPGVVLDVMAVIGADATRHLRTAEDITAAQLEALAPDLVTILLGGNEVKRIAWGSATRSSVARDMRRLLARVKKAAPEAACLVTGPLENILGGQPVRKERRVVVKKPFATRKETRVVNDIMRAAAHDAGCAYLDLFAAMGEEGALRRLHAAGLLHRDKIHPIGRGLDLIGALIDDALMRRYEQSPRFAVDDSEALDAAASPARDAKRRAYALRIDGERVVLRGEHGASLLAIPAVLDVEYGAGRERLRGEWAQEAPGVVVARALSPRARVTFRVETDEDTPHLRASVEVEYTRTLEVKREEWTWHPLDGEGHALDRAYRLRALDTRPLLVDRWTPRIVRLGAGGGDVVTLIGHDDFQGMRATKSAITLELDHEENHPHSVYEDCLDTYGASLARTQMSRRTRTRGERARYAAVFLAGDAALPVLARWPEGRRAAFVIVDHADRTTPRSLRTLLTGSSREKSTTSTGLLDRDMRITQTVFASKTQLEDPAFRALIDELAARGSEIAPHSITPGRDSARTIARALHEDFGPYTPRTWVDHQPQTNCEALNNVGGTPHDGREVTRAMLDGGVRYAWEAPDFRTWDGLDLLRPHRPAMRTSVFYPASPILTGRDDTLWLFRSAWQFVPKETLVARLRPRALDELEASHGVHIAHTYLGFIDDDGPFAERTVFVRKKYGALELDPQFARAMADLGRRQRTGTLWVTPLGDLGDWLSRWSRARVVHAGPSALLVRHVGSEGDASQVSAPYAWRALDDGLFVTDAVPVLPQERTRVERLLFDDELGVRVEKERRAAR